MELFSTPVENPKSRGGRPKGSKNKKPYPVTEAYRQACRDRMMAKSPEERSALARCASMSQSSAQKSHAAKALWTPEYRALVSERNKARGIVPPSRRGKTNKNPYPYSEAVLNRMKECTNVPYKGRFRPNNPQKYSGDPTNIVFRSGIELRFMSYLDSNPGVVSWVSEETIVPYFDPATNRYRRYFPDFLVVVKHGTGTLTQLIEIKPLSQTLPPKGTPHQDGRKNRRLLKEQLTYITNQAKFAAATEYAADRGWKFKVITDKDIQGLK